LNFLAALQKLGFLRSLENEDLIFRRIDGNFLLIDIAQRAAHGD